MKKIFLLLISIVFIVIVWQIEDRSFYYSKNGECVTVWRAYDGRCYVIPKKYKGILRPSSDESYIITPYINGMDIIWQDNAIIVNLEDDQSQVIHNCSTGVQIVNYNLNKRYNDSVLLYFDKGYYRYKKDIDYLTINIKEGYAYNKDGKRQE